MSASDLPSNVTSCVVAASSPMCDPCVRDLARTYVIYNGSDLRGAPSFALPAGGDGDEAQTLLEIAALRRVLLLGCDVRMSGSHHSYTQATPTMRWLFCVLNFLMPRCDVVQIAPVTGVPCQGI